MKVQCDEVIAVMAMTMMMMMSQISVEQGLGYRDISNLKQELLGIKRKRGGDSSDNPVP